MSETHQPIYRFAGFSLDMRAGLLRSGSGDITLRPKSLDLLTFLIRNAGRVMSKDELLRIVWNDVIVTEDSLSQCISDIRRALGDKEQKLIRTVPKRGYILPSELLEAHLVPAARPMLESLDKPTLAVLPFQNLSGDAEQEYFADGVVEDIITALTRFRDLFVIARNSSFTYKGRSVDVKQVGRELGARYVVEGSVRRAGDRLRITGQLIDTSTGANLWADRFDGALAGVFALQDEVASSIVGAITPKVEEAEIERAKRKPTESLDAYDYYLRGLAAFYRATTHRPTIDDALRLFIKAIDRDPEFAIAHARAARCYATRKSNGWMVDRAQEIAEATRLARRAIELGRDDAIALSYGGYVLGYVSGDLDDAAACIDRALTLNPHLANALGSSGWVRACLGEPDTAIEHSALAMRVSPLDPRLFAWQFNTGLAHFCAGRYDDAVVWAGRSLTQHRNYASAMRVVAAGHALAGRLAEAQGMVARLCEFDPALRLSNLADVLPPFRRLDDHNRYIEALRRAGLRE